MSVPRANLAALLLLIGGLSVSAYLLDRSFALRAGAAGGDVCSIALGRSCDETLAHPYSRQLGIPLAGWGVLYFAGVLALLGRRGVRLLACAGALASVSLIGLLLFGGVPLCPLCLVANGLNLAAIGPVWTWRGGGLVRPPAVAYGVTLLLTVGLFAWMRAASDAGPPDPGAILAAYEAEPVVEIPLTGDEPVLGPAAAKAQLIVFSDALCPHCKRFWAMLREVTGRYGEDVRITFKHFPLDATCNPGVRETVHEHACVAGRALEAARLQDAFWEYDRALKAPARPGRKKTFRTVAEDVGLDVAKFVADFAGETVRARMRRDIELGNRIGLRETPAVFLNGRRVRPPSPDGLRRVLDHVTGR